VREEEHRDPERERLRPQHRRPVERVDAQEREEQRPEDRRAHAEPCEGGPREREAREGDEGGRDADVLEQVPEREREEQDMEPVPEVRVLAFDRGEGQPAESALEQALRAVDPRVPYVVEAVSVREPRDPRVEREHDRGEDDQAERGALPATRTTLPDQGARILLPHELPPELRANGWAVCAERAILPRFRAHSEGLPNTPPP
jgi:hypothetical protein